MSFFFVFLALIADQSPLRWGGDAESGAPFVEADPRDPSKVRGFDAEVAEEIAKGLGRRSEFVQVALTDPAFQRRGASMCRSL
jgi:ABC-type amino acid transport substrate-binding protein